jgi:hypothetical protein
MTSNRRYIALPLILLLSCLCVERLTHAQNTIPLVPGSPTPNQGERLEVEQIEVRRGGATPAEIHRNNGRFLLVVINHAGSIAPAGFVIESSSIGNLKLGPNPLLRLGSLASSDTKHRSAALFDAQPGSFDLKNAGTGEVIGKILID